MAANKSCLFYLNEAVVEFQVKHIVNEMSKRVEGDEFEGQSPFRSAHEVTRCAAFCSLDSNIEWQNSY